MEDKQEENYTMVWTELERQQQETRRVIQRQSINIHKPETLKCSQIDKVERDTFLSIEQIVRKFKLAGEAQIQSRKLVNKLSQIQDIDFNQFNENDPLNQLNIYQDLTERQDIRVNNDETVKKLQEEYSSLERERKTIEKDIKEDYYRKQQRKNKKD